MLKQTALLKKWTLSSSKRLAQRQYALLTAALLTVRSKGRIIYSTCAISPLENDAVIQELSRRKGSQFKPIELSPRLGGFERTEFGCLYLPDNLGYGPIYLAGLERL